MCLCPGIILQTLQPVASQETTTETLSVPVNNNKKK